MSPSRLPDLRVILAIACALSRMCTAACKLTPCHLSFAYVRRRVIAALVLLIFSHALLAQNADVAEPQYDIYQLSAEAEIDVANDLMTVNMVATASGSDPAQLANTVNATTSWAINKLRPFTAIDTQTLDYQTYPQYEKNGSRVKNWMASQSIQLETDDFEQAGKAIQQLQERMQVRGMQLKAKADTRERAEEQLINTAMEAFKRRALIVQTNMGARGYRVMELSINTGGPAAQFRDHGYPQAATDKLSIESAPAIQAGSSTVKVHINGRIQLE